MKRTWILFFAAAAGLTAGCDDATPGSGGSGSTSSSFASTTTTTKSSSSTGGMLGTCGDFCAGKSGKAASLMCTAINESDCNVSCEQNLEQALTCEPLFVTYYECVSKGYPSADCACGPSGLLDCADFCTNEYDAASQCLFML